MIPRPAIGAAWRLDVARPVRRRLARFPGVDAGRLREALIDLAREAGLEVRFAEAAQAGDGPGPASDSCKVRGAVWVILSRADPVEVHVEVLAATLHAHAREWLAGRYLPPALRERLLPREF